MCTILPLAIATYNGVVANNSERLCTGASESKRRYAEGVPTPTEGG